MDDFRHPKIVFVIPALNEEKTIGGIVSHLKSFGEVRVVDDGSTDDTAVLARDAGAKVTSHLQPKGYDKALISGFLAESDNPDIDWVVTVDADGQHDASSFPGLFAHIKSDQFDLVLGVRDCFPRVSEQILARYFVNKWQVPDPLCGLKAYRKSLLGKINFSDFIPLDTVGTLGMLGLLAQNARVATTPVKINERVDAPRFGSTLRANWRILKLLSITPRIWKALQSNEWR